MIDPEVARYWKENFDIGYILQRDWKTLGPKLQGKINIYVGDMDNYYLNNAVYLVEAFLESTKDPYYARRGEIRRPGRALLERRSQAAERHLAPAVPPDVYSASDRAAAQNRAPRSGPEELEILISGEIAAAPAPIKFSRE